VQWEGWGEARGRGEATTDNAVLDAWDDCTNEERARGRRWYPQARETAFLISDQEHLRFTAGVLAALSPGISWAHNVRAARALYAGRGCTGYGPNVAKARRILRGEEPETVLSGPKVTAFYRLIRDGGNWTDVCIDGHALNIALRRGKLRLRDSYARPDEVDEARALYYHAAIVLDEKPCTVQAATWLAWRASGGFVQGRLDLGL